MRYAKILPQLFLGSRPEIPADIDRLRLESGITAVLNLQTDDDMRALNLLWEPLEQHYRSSGVQLCRVPVRDFDPVDLREKLPECVRALTSLLSVGHTVYLHCTLGVTRSPTVAVAYLLWCQGWKLDQAVTHIKDLWQCTPNVKAVQLALRTPEVGGTPPA
jgi:protein-tyrosine phosphatase